MARRRPPSSFVELIDRMLRKKKIFRRRFLILLMVLVWFGVACWLFVSDQYSGRLASEDDLKFLALKITALSVVSGVGIFLTWIFADRKKSG